VLAVAGEHDIERTQRARRSDLGGFLTLQRRPQPELAVALERRRLGVVATGQHHVAEEGAQVVVVAGELEPVVGHPLTLGGEQLHHVRHRALGRITGHDRLHRAVHGFVICLRSEVVTTA